MKHSWGLENREAETILLHWLISPGLRAAYKIIHLRQMQYRGDLPFKPTDFLTWKKILFIEI